MPVFKLSPRDYANPHAPRHVVGDPAHVGLVLGTVTECERIMSDVWSDTTYAVVWDPETAAPRRVFLNCAEFGREATAEVDATAEVVAAYDAWLAARAAEAKAADEARWEAAAEARVRRIEKGHQVVVARGRKVKKGTTGRVFWIGSGSFGLRAGIETDAGETVWTALDNLNRVIDKPEGMTWREFEMEACAAAR
jgi:hypothetical protein